MSSTNVIEIPIPFAQFLAEVDRDYRQRLHLIALFDESKTMNLSKEQKKFFATVFYHLRGHFINFMWYVANFSNDASVKKIILDNIYEELGAGSRLSHEKLYERFALECGVDIHDEIVNGTNYLPFAKEFNKKHLHWLATHDAKERLAAFSAYERLDNIDYSYLTQFANSLKLPPIATTFFSVHMHVEHFESTIEKLVPIWLSSEKKVQNAFNFIYSHQIHMWEQLSKAVFD